MISPARLITIVAAVGLLVGGLTLNGKAFGGGLTFRDEVYSFKQHVKLTVMVTRHSDTKPVKYFYTVRKGKTKVGNWSTEGAGGCAGLDCTWGATGNMKIGKPQGTVKLSARCHGKPGTFPNVIFPKKGTITITKTSKPGVVETATLKSECLPPETVGTKFAIILNY